MDAIVRLRAGLMMVAACCSLTAAAQDLAELRRRADILDDMAKAEHAIQLCNGPPKTIAIQVARDAGYDPDRDGKELPLVRLAVKSQVPVTPTRACIFLEEQYGRDGARVRGLVVLDGSRAVGKQAGGESDASQWRTGLQPIERACIDAIEGRGDRLSGATVVSRNVRTRQSVTEFRLRMAVRGSIEGDARDVTCVGDWSDGRISVKTVD